jgi:hypothetical protein
MAQSLWRVGKSSQQCALSCLLWGSWLRVASSRLTYADMMVITMSRSCPFGEMKSAGGSATAICAASAVSNVTYADSCVTTPKKVDRLQHSTLVNSRATSVRRARQRGAMSLYHGLIVGHDVPELDFRNAAATTATHTDHTCHISSAAAWNGERELRTHRAALCTECTQSAERGVSGEGRHRPKRPNAWIT